MSIGHGPILFLCGPFPLSEDVFPLKSHENVSVRFVDQGFFPTKSQT